MDRSSASSPIQVVDYDAVWKEVVQTLFPDCMAFLFPDVEAMIDWSTKPVFLNVEMPKLLPEVSRGMRRPDLVAQVALKDGQPALIILHTEIQVSQDPQFAERMFVYFYHLRERYRLPVMSLAILADPNPNWHPTYYEYRLGGTVVRFEFQTVKLLKLDPTRLESEHPIALFIRAHLASLRYRGNPTLLAEEKKRLLRGMLERGYNSQQIRYLYKVVDYLMSLPYDLEREVEAVIEEIKRRRRRKWIAPQERLAVERALKQGLEEGREKGFQEGVKQGIQQGIQQGVEAGARETILAILQARFGNVPEEVHQRLTEIHDIQQLRRLSVSAAQARTIAEFVETIRPDS
ncbi:MAG: hypothetical protein SNJ72_10955 [Fimbriimonadales bacterium]